MSYRVRLLFVTGIALATMNDASAQPVLNYQSHELKQGRNYIQKLTSLLAVGESSGDLNYRYVFDLPPGRGITPELALEYSSHAAGSEYGWGWELTVPMIERSDEHGVPSYSISPTFRFRSGHTVRELTAMGIDLGTGWEQYRETREATYARYYRDPNLNLWHVVRTDGTRIDLGAYNSRRGPNPTIGFDGTDAWLANQIVDSRGNYATYTYENDPYAVAPVRNSRLFSIAYNGNSNVGQAPNISVTLTWATHWGIDPPVPTSYRHGYRRAFGRDHLASIVVQAPQMTTGTPAQVPANSPTTRTWTLGYPPTSGVTTDNMFYLSWIQLGTEPPISFSYSNAVVSGQGSIDTQKVFEPDAVDFPNDLGRTSVTDNGNGTSTSKTTRVLADVDSDGRPDLIEIEPTSCNGYVVWRNTGTGFVRHTWPALTTSDPALPDTCALRVVNTAAGAEADTVQDFVDVTGDGYPDLIYTVGTGPIFVAYCPGTGSGFGPCAYFGDLYSSPSGGPFLRRDLLAINNASVADVDLVDIDADGLPDLASLDTSNGQLSVYKNIGRGFAKDPYFVQMPACNQFGFPYCLRASMTSTGSGTNRFQLAELRDVNGDGIADFVATSQSGPISIAFGTGTGFSAYSIASTNPVDLGTGFQTTGSSGGDYVETTVLADINADGLPDIVAYDCRGGNLNASVRYNNGGAWDSGWRTLSLSWPQSSPWFEQPCTHRDAVVSTVGTTTTFKVTAQLVDMNGDGIADFASAELDPYPIPPYPYFVTLVRQVAYQPPRKMVTSTSLDAHHFMTVTWGAVDGDTPYPVHVPTQVTRTRTTLYANEPSRNTSVSTTYSYSPPTFNRQERRFGGFGLVTATGDSFATVRTTFYTTFDVNPEPGLVLTQNTVNRSAVGTWEYVSNTYQTDYDNPPRRSTTWLTKHESLPGSARDIVTDYTGRDDYGGITNWTDEGDPGAPDNIVHTRTFVTRDDTDFIIHVASVESATSATGGASSTTRAYYDDPNNLGATPTLGELRKIEHETDANVYVNKQYAYDAYGNVVQETDEAGYTNTFAYDQTYHAYKVSTTNTIGVVYTSYHSLTGDVAESCGPQNSSGTWNCHRTEEDFLGRVIAEYVPTLANGVFGEALLTTVTYDDHAYPLVTTVTKRGLSRSVEYRDGFGNATEVRVEETPNNFRIFETAFDGYGYPLRIELPHRETGIAYTHTPVSTEAWVYQHDYVHASIESITYPRDVGDNSPPAVATRIVTPAGVSVTDEDGRETDFDVDGHGRINHTARYGGVLLGVAETYFTYSTHGDVLTVTDPNNLITTYTRNRLGWMTAIQTPDFQTTAFQYNGRGQVAQKTDPLGVVVTYGYEPSGRPAMVLSANEPSGVRHVDFAYHYYDPLTCQRDETALCDQNRGWLRDEVSDGRTGLEIDQVYTYTPEGAVATHKASAPFFSASGMVTMTYATGSLLQSVAYPDGYVATYVNNLDDSVAQVTHLGTILASISYADNGQPSAISNQLGLGENTTYDARGRATNIASFNTHISAGPLVQDHVTWTKASYVASITRLGLLPGLVPRQQPDVYAVTNDGLGRVGAVTRNGAPFAQYSYDLGDRMTGMSENGAPPGSSTFVHDQLLSRTQGSASQSWVYNAAGNVTHDETRQDGSLTRARDHVWDAVGNYAQTTKVGSPPTTYYYTPRGAVSRVIAPGDGATFDDVMNVGELARYSLFNQTWTDRILVGSRVIGEVKGPRFEMPHRTLGDSVLAVTNDLGMVIRQEEFKPYGGHLLGSTTGSFEQHFHGMRTDALVVAGGRAYDPDGGVWLSRDPLARGAPGEIAKDPRRASMYGFNFGNPYARRDPGGEDPVRIDHEGWGEIRDSEDPRIYQVPDVDRGRIEEAHGKWAAAMERADQGVVDANWIFDVVAIAKAAPSLINLGQSQLRRFVVKRTLQANKRAGAAWAKAVGEELKATEDAVASEVTVKTKSGARTRLDWLTKKGEVYRCIECKASATAKLTKAQALTHPEIEASGATIVGKGKPGFPGGTEIPPTKVEIVRP